MNADDMDLDEVEPPPPSVKEIIDDAAYLLRLSLMKEAPHRIFQGRRSFIPNWNTVFYIDRCPTKGNRPKCSLRSCSLQIERDEFRLTLQRPLAAGKSQRIDYFHLACFEKIADFAQAEFHGRLKVLTEANVGHRGLPKDKALKSDYYCEAGAEMLALAWIEQRGNLINARCGVQQALSPALEGPLTPADSLRSSQVQYSSTDLVTWEKDGPDNAREWSLLDSYLNAGDNDENLDSRHSLSNMLKRWRHDKPTPFSPPQWLVTTPHLTNSERQERVQLGDKAITAIKRLGPKKTKIVFIRRSM
ncbi:MAG: hypothetical protein M4579_007361 [Chaenotheca gracillima]|nr:MAG: hypothetical protein M4579_007361 [Chaenotheca gracillima]